MTGHIMLKITRRGKIVATSTALLLLAGAYALASNAELNATNPDWTVAPCSATHIPAYTFTDRCVSATGEIVSR